MRGLGGLDNEIDTLAKVCQFLKKALELPPVHLVKLAAPPHRHQEKDLPEDDLELAHQFRHGVKLIPIVCAKGGVDLQRESHRLRVPTALQGDIEGSWHISKGIVDLRSGTVQAESYLMQPCIFEALDQRNGSAAELLRVWWPFACLDRFHGEPTRKDLCAW